MGIIINHHLVQSITTSHLTSVQIRTLPIGVVLDQKMKQFKNAVPLMVNLKHEAMRDRHWNRLMEQTGQVFDMHPDRFTLANMFAMELHKYQVQI